MQPIYLLVQRWFADGEGWAYDSSLPADLRLEAVQQITNVASQYCGEQILPAEPIQIGQYNLWILIRKDKDCPDEKAVSRLPHIDIGVLIPRKLEVRSDLIIRYFRYAQEKIQHRGVFAPVHFLESENTSKKRFPWGCVLMCVGLLVGGGLGTWIGSHKKEPNPEKPEPKTEESVESGTMPLAVVEEKTDSTTHIEPPVVPPQPEIPLFDVSKSRETKLIRDWKFYGLSSESDSKRLNKFIEFANKPHELLQTLGDSRHPEILFLREFPQVSLEPFEAKMSQEEYNQKIQSVCQAFGVAEFADIARKFPDYGEFCEGLKELRLDQPISSEVMIFMEKYTGKRFDTSRNLEAVKLLREWQLPILKDVDGEKILNAFIERVVNTPQKLYATAKDSQHPEVLFLTQFPKQSVSLLGEKALPMEFEARIREICNVFGVEHFRDLGDMLPRFQDFCATQEVKNLKEPTTPEIHDFVMRWTRDALDSQAETARVVSSQTLECKKVPWLVIAEYFENLQPDCVTFEEAARLSSEERKLVEKLNELGQRKMWKFTGRNVQEVREEYDAIQRVYDRIEKKGGRK